MKILVFTYIFEIGGIQRNAIDLGVKLRDNHGHEIVFFATPGPMVRVAEELGLRFLPAPPRVGIPSIEIMSSLRAAVRREKPDLIHVWDWPHCIDAYYAVHLPMGVPMIVTDMMSDKLITFMPKYLLTTFGSPEFVDMAKAAGYRRAEPLLPPVDIQLNAPGAVDPGPFRDQWNIKDDELTLVTVSRLVSELKGESLIRTIQAIRVLGTELPLRLILVGDGNARSRLERLAVEVNAELGRPAVIFCGELLDPRPAYAAADIVIGMGGSALRGMAFGKPTIVVGAQGFSAPVTPANAPTFHYRGMFGVGNGAANNDRLAADIRTLAENHDDRQALGKFSRQFVVDNFSLENISAQFERYCCDAVAGKRTPVWSALDGLRTFLELRFSEFAPTGIREFIARVSAAQAS